MKAKRTAKVKQRRAPPVFIGGAWTTTPAAVAPLPRPVYLAESDPRQVLQVRPYATVPMPPEYIERVDRILFADENTTEALARKFGQWVRGADGTWFRRRPRKTTKET